ncbi:hypothetical protein OG21DRAFT_1498653 [Imleria badia]|nr:hypothetical protein OG21DRAFT_1498653 [Imleria badia]
MKRAKRSYEKVTNGSRWIVILGGCQHIEELRKAPDVVLSFIDGRTRTTSKSSVPVLLRTYSEIRDEVSVAFDEVLDLRDSDEWYNSFIVNLVAEVGNFQNGWILVAYLLIDVPGNKKRALKHLAPVIIIEGRLELQEEHGNDWADKPKDLLSWMLDEAPEDPERTVKLWTTLILATNFASIHPSAKSTARWERRRWGVACKLVPGADGLKQLYQALFFLADNLQYIQPTLSNKRNDRKPHWGRCAKPSAF